MSFSKRARPNTFRILTVLFLVLASLVVASQTVGVASDIARLFVLMLLLCFTPASRHPSVAARVVAA
jgi:hypothetical protein